MSKHNKTKSNKFILLLLLIVLICSITIFVATLIKQHIDDERQKEISQVLSTITVPEGNVTDEMTKRQLQLKELQNENQDIVAWLEIEDTNINYPVLQGQDNDYYLTHNYKGEKISSGSIFLDKDYNFTQPSANLLIYGHRNKQGLMFEDLMKYSKEDFYTNHKTIRFTTVEEDATYEILSVFYSRVYYQNEKNVFRYYKFVNSNSQEEYNNYVNEAKKVSIYDTSVEAEYGDQLLTLSTCEYSKANGRFVVVAKKVK